MELEFQSPEKQKLSEDEAKVRFAQDYEEVKRILDGLSPNRLQREEPNYF